MPLEEYRAKRNFARSPEPRGAEKAAARSRKGTPGFFCVQKHLATALHYDLRLEHNGVLLSWAVPKGPSLIPADKRLAMQVEDHPLEYGTFEGVIPEGYGAGVVMLWDQGMWEPEEDDVDAALARGDLKFTLDGFKLKGSWVLVRTKGYGPPRGRAGGSEGKAAWLLIKHRDDWAGPVDITTFAPNSVKSGGSFKDILMAEAPEIWHSHKAAGKPGDDSLRKIVEKVLKYEEELEAATASAPGAAGTAEPAPTPAASKSSATKTKTARPAGKTAKSAQSGSANPRAAKAGAAKPVASKPGAAKR